MTENIQLNYTASMQERNEQREAEKPSEKWYSFCLCVCVCVQGKRNITFSHGQTLQLFTFRRGKGAREGSLWKENAFTLTFLRKPIHLAKVLKEEQRRTLNLKNGSKCDENKKTTAEVVEIEKMTLNSGVQTTPRQTNH